MVNRFLDESLWRRVDDLREAVGEDSHHYQTIDDLVAEVDRLEGEILRQRRYVAPIERLLLAISAGAIFLPTALSERLDFVVRHINPALRADERFSGKLHDELEEEIDALKEKIRVYKKILKRVKPCFKVTLTGKGRWRVYGSYLEVTPEEHVLLEEIEEPDCDEGL